MYPLRSFLEEGKVTVAIQTNSFMNSAPGWAIFQSEERKTPSTKLHLISALNKRSTVNKSAMAVLPVSARRKGQYNVGF